MKWLTKVNYSVFNFIDIISFLPFVLIVSIEVTILTKALGVVISISVLTLVGLALSSIEMIAMVAHSLCIVLHRFVGTVRYLSLLPVSLFLFLTVFFLRTFWLLLNSLFCRIFFFLFLFQILFFSLILIVFTLYFILLMNFFFLILFNGFFIFIF